MAKLDEISSESGSDPAYSDDEPHLNLTEEDKIRLIEQYAGLKPSEVLKGAKPTPKDKPLVVLSPAELQELVAQQEEEAAEKDEDVEEDDAAFWEECVNAVMWSVPFAFLFYGMNIAAHKQFGQDYKNADGLSRLLNFVPALLILNFLSSRPPSRSFLPPTAIQALLSALCVASGSSLVHVTTTESFLQVIKQAPALGVLWVWSVVRLDLGWAVGGLVGVCGVVWVRGDKFW